MCSSRDLNYRLERMMEASHLHARRQHVLITDSSMKVWRAFALDA